jgi:hypothetical protein
LDLVRKQRFGVAEQDWLEANVVLDDHGFRRMGG